MFYELSENEDKNIKLNEDNTLNVSKESKEDHREIKQMLLIKVTHIQIILKEMNKEELFKFISNVRNKNEDKLIVGLFSARTNSYPLISLKDEEIFFEIKEILTERGSNEDLEEGENGDNLCDNNDYNSIPLLFFSFSFSNNNSSSENIPSDTMFTFQSKLFIHDDKKNTFQSLKFEIFNLMEHHYTGIVEPISNLVDIESDFNEFEEEVKKLREEITNSLDEIDSNLSKKLINAKKMLIKEIDNFNKLSNRLKILRNIKIDK